MFGALRLILAILVVAAHCELPQQFNPGVAAVVVFFLISGFVMTANVRRYYTAPGSYFPFLQDRACRIFPQYLLWLGVTVA